MGCIRAVDTGVTPDEPQPRAQVLVAKNVEPEQMQRDVQVAAWVGRTSRTVEAWGPTRQVLALALYVGATMQRRQGIPGDWDPDTDMRRFKRVMALFVVDFGAPQEPSTGQISATGAADGDVID